MLLGKGARVDATRRDGETPLYVASESGHADVVQLLLGNGARVDAAMENGATPLFTASENGHEDVVRLLLDAGATWSHLCTRNEDNPPGCLRDPISFDCVDTETGPVFINAHDPEGRVCYAQPHPMPMQKDPIVQSRPFRALGVTQIATRLLRFRTGSPSKLHDMQGS